MKRFPAFRTGAKSSFTLVEILVAVAVMSLILLILAQMTGTVNQAWQAGVGRVDNFTKARAILDLAASDVQHAVIRNDYPIFQSEGAQNNLGVYAVPGTVYFTNTTTAVSMPGAGFTGYSGFTNGTYAPCLYTRVAGATNSARDLSWVDYQVVQIKNQAASSDRITLARYCVPVQWTAQNLDNLTSLMTNVSTFVNNLVANPNYYDSENLAPGVCGFTFSFKTLNNSTTPPTISTTTNYVGYIQTDPVVAVGITVAVIGRPTLTKLTDAQITQIQNALNTDVNTAVGNNTLSSVKKLWDNNTIPNTILKTAGYPKDLEVNLKTFERWVVPPQPF
jgi:type II secretory pathway pseudopilin PulG